ncbi:MAG: class I SAM-dependent methyltransferase [Planctomycetota bacterium]|nr:class I SAM-dependent methyltransferase [Planctomycetota bacterium]
MGFYGDHVLPRGIAWGMQGRAFREQRGPALTLARGRVLELGFGAGHNLEHYPAAVEEVLALEPATVNRKLAAKRVAAARMPVRWVGLEGESVPLEDDTVDTVVSTWTLCTIPGLGQALAEVRRVLRPGGELLFLEHGLSPDPKVARWQNRLNPLQRRLCGGCHLNRRIDAELEAAGFDLRALETFAMKGPRIATWMYRGRATQ